MTTKDNGHDRLLDHDYDGIHEYDNAMPRWWLYIFYATIAYAVLYVLNVVPGVGIGTGRVASYESDVTAARARYGAPAAPGAEPSEAVLTAAARDEARLAKGKNTFATMCAPCHGADGGGVIGPNLTDDYWIHGGRPAEIWRTVASGVPDKGMPAWSQSLGPEEVLSAVAYVVTLRGTTPSSPKAPQGVREAEAPAPLH